MKITISQEGTSPISIYVSDIKDTIEHKKYNKIFKLDIPSTISKYVTGLTCADNSENSDYDCCSTISINVNSNIF